MAMAQEKKKVDGGLAEIKDKVAPTRSPSRLRCSLSAKSLDFAQHCTGCQLCVTECPNQVLRPSTNLLRLMQPEMSYERGFCRPECTRCSQVCPAGAIKPVERADKAAIQIGHAVWIKDNCVVLTDHVNCGNCARHCPAGAISMEPMEALWDGVSDNIRGACSKYRKMHRLWSLRECVSVASVLRHLCGRPRSAS